MVGSYGRLCEQVPTREGSQGAAALTLNEPKERSGVDGICAILSERDLPADSAVLTMVLTLWGGLSQDDLSTEALDAAIMSLCGLTELPPVVAEQEPEAAAAKLSLPPSHDLWLSDVPQFPDKNYCVLTQPHDLPQSNFLSSMFTQIRPKIGTSFHHVLYLAHRDSFFARISGSPLLLADRNPHWEVAVLPPSSGLASLDWSKLEPVASSITDKHRDSLQQYAFVCSPYRNRFAHRRYQNDEIIVITVLLDAQPVAMVGVEMITSNDNEADAIDMLRYCYDVDQYLSPAAYKGSGSCCRLIHWSIIPILIGQTRRILNMANTALGTRLMSIAVSNSLSHVDSRLSLASSSGRSGILDEFMDESDTPTARWQQREWRESIGGRQEKALENHGKRLRFLEGTLRDAHTQCESMKILAKKMILYKKCIVNARIIVVGASDTGLSTLSSLMSMPRLHFTSLTLLAPGGISYFLDDELDPLTDQEASLSRLFKSQASERGHTASLRQVRRLTATTGAFSPRELRRLMMDSRVRILDARMISLNRGAKTISVVPSCLSSADSSCDKILGDGSILLKSLIWNPLSYAVIYGRALDSYCAIQGLLGRLVPPKKIVLVLPPRRSRETIADEDEVLPVDAFEEGEAVEQKLHSVLESIGVRVHSDLTLTGVEQDTRQRLSAVRLIGLPADTDKSEEPQGTRGGPVCPRLALCALYVDTRYKITCRVLLTADGHSVDPRIFSCIYANELVYDGRLIVDHLFRTIDENIFAAGTLCEFSRRYVEAQDGYNGREVGGRLAEAIVK
ncbi:hypothetical protein Pmar_PMAR014813 [Perkinsus marinus ATCC 50983]|uniref:Cilia- and flagella-associated protein 61 N-terminal domain-containing protein n=1 Tax=Perkinsus marinus (strain ATCC 50983 / TXsc) TaxID=423536 RepID=C5LT10_PERM5|nr:hypothetical protein Pmar_PMAR014813 [Perkinsus marinus ATCC 50983]EER00147.1 hypothetical protein Pmar_PMAR014813 [Perkinsus marinus ATCC 50983]|eukprot:XP_002767429.1 hypothetical protein Pmar_PMAR014813 [Perkinsus marinus ATCC 50983]